MATITRTVCDMHENSDIEAVEKRDFAVAGTKYTLDLCQADADALDAQLAPYMEAAERHDTHIPRRRSEPLQVNRANRNGNGNGLKTPVRRGKRNNPTGRGEYAAIREWAARKGIEVNQAGRISPAVIEQYHREAVSA